MAYITLTGIYLIARGRLKVSDIYRPLPFRPGNKIIRQYIEHFDDGAGHFARVTKIDFTDKKGRQQDPYTLFVEWIN